MIIPDEQVSSLLRAKHQRATPQRQIVLAALRQMRGHITPEAVCAEVQRQLPGINRSTVYRTLDFLQSIGLITSTVSEGGRVVYEVVSAEAHHHLVCQHCGDEQTIPQAAVAPFLVSLYQTYDFQVVETLHLTLFGCCAACRTAASHATETPLTHKETEDGA